MGTSIFCIMLMLFFLSFLSSSDRLRQSDMMSMLFVIDLPQAFIWMAVLTNKLPLIAPFSPAYLRSTRPTDDAIASNPFCASIIAVMLSVPKTGFAIYFTTLRCRETVDPCLFCPLVALYSSLRSLCPFRRL